MNDDPPSDLPGFSLQISVGVGFGEARYGASFMAGPGGTGDASGKAGGLGCGVAEMACYTWGVEEIACK